MPPVAFATAVFAAYSAMVHSRYRNLAIGAVLVITLAATATFADTLPRFPGRLTALFAIIPAVAAGLGIRELRRRLNDSAARLRRATEEHEAATRRALEAERARIAGELHDVVTHNVSVMVVQAGAARTVLASSPAEAEQALLAVEAGGRTAMAELRNLLGLLSPSGDDEVALRPQPGLGELDTLIGRVSAAGLPVQLQVSGTPRPLPPGADLAAYRVVQEALTNVLRHAGQAATSVIVRWGDKLVITVSDNGCGANGGGVPGRGLLGLRERLSLYGGQLDAGPRPGGGWQVRAVMPTGLSGMRVVDRRRPGAGARRVPADPQICRDRGRRRGSRRRAGGRGRARAPARRRAHGHPDARAGRDRGHPAHPARHRPSPTCGSSC